MAGLQLPQTGTIALSHLREGESGVLARLDVPEDISIRLQELGFLPGCRITAIRPAPGGDPLVFRLDGTEIALRRETARRISVARAR